MLNESLASAITNPPNRRNQNDDETALPVVAAAVSPKRLPASHASGRVNDVRRLFGPHAGQSRGALGAGVEKPADSMTAFFLTPDSAPVGAPRHTGIGQRS